MAVEREQLLKMAKLARLHFTDDELQRMEKSLGQLVDYVDTLQKLDLKDVEPMLAVDTAPRPMRVDEIGPSLTKEAAFRNAPEVNLDHFSIPKVIGG
jgi:aspartyl-tRNA(Asn)/glutamyl-tRNA(Gln) amidotransferase subunit C